MPKNTEGVIGEKGLGRVRPPDWEHVERYPLRGLPDRVLAELTPPPPNTVLRHELPMRYNQGQTPRCVDFGSCTYMSAIELLNEQQRVQFRPGYLYRWAVRHDGIPGDPGGTTVRAGMDYARQLGMIPVHSRDLRRKITENRWCQSMSEVLAVLYRQPVPIGISWLAGMMDPRSDGIIRAQGSDVGGHFTTLFGMDLPAGLVDVGNTWGPHWWREAPDEGQSWNARLPLEDLERLLFSMDGEAVAVTDRLERRTA